MVLGGERVVLVADSGTAEDVLITRNSVVSKVIAYMLITKQKA